MNQNVTINNDPCGCAGCGSVIGVLLLIGLAVEYWYIALPIAVLAVGGFAWYYSQLPDPQEQQAQQVQIIEAPPVARAEPRVMRTCTGCGQHDLSSAYCPKCGAPTV